MREPLTENPEKYNPLITAMKGRDEDDQILLSSEFLLLPENLQDLLVGSQFLEKLESWIASGLFPESHAEAIAKLIGILAFDDSVLASQVTQVLISLGIESSKAKLLQQEIAALIDPILAYRTADTQANQIEEMTRFQIVEAPALNPLPPEPTSITPLPPLTTSKPVPVPPPPNRTTIDLRDKKLMP